MKSMTLAICRVVFGLAALWTIGLTPAHSEDVVTILENDRVRVLEVTFRPGDTSKLMERPYRIVRALTDGTLDRSNADGSTEHVTWKAGQVREYGPDKYSLKNVGSSDFVVYVVIPK